MNKQQQKNQFTWIVQAEKNHEVFKPHYFKSADKALQFFDNYLIVMVERYNIHALTISSRASVFTCRPCLAAWYKKYEGRVKKHS